MAEYSRKFLDGGIGYTTIIDPKFKTQRIQVTFMTELKNETAAENALAIGIIGSSNSKYKNISEITAKMNALYGANINAGATGVSDNQELLINVSTICNKYALEGEDVESEVLSVLLDCIFSPNVEKNPDTGKMEFASEPFNFRKKDLLDTIDAEINNKRRYAIMQAKKSSYVNESCAISAYGTKETAEAVTPESAYEAYQRLLNTAQIEILYVGPVASDNAEKRISEAFSKLDRNPVEVKFYNSSPLKSEVCRAEEKLDVNQCKMVMAFKGDCEDYDAVRVMNTVFGSSPFSKLFVNVREKYSLCYYCASSYERYKKTMHVDCGIEEQNIEKAESEIIRQLEEVQNGNFSDEDMNNAILSIVNSLKGVGDTPISYIVWYLNCYSKGKVSTPEEDAKNISAVTRERIIEAAKSFKLDTVYVMRGE